MMKKGFALFMAGAMMVSRPVMAATNTETAAMVSQAVSVSMAPRILFADVSSDGRSSIETMLNTYDTISQMPYNYGIHGKCHAPGYIIPQSR